MRLTTFLLLLVILAALGTAGYFWQMEKHARDKMSLYEEWNSELRFAADAMKAENAHLQARLSAEVSKVSEEKEQEIKRLNEAQDMLIEELKSEIEQREIQITQLADRLSVRVADQILFPSGKTELSDAGLKVLSRLGNIIKGVKNKVIRVEGHTDNVPIHSRLQKTFPTNWELSAARAINVVRFLQEKTGIDPRKLEAVGQSEYHPVATNNTSSGRRQNRRIEIIMAPATPVLNAATR